MTIFSTGLVFMTQLKLPSLALFFFKCHPLFRLFHSKKKQKGTNLPSSSWHVWLFEAKVAGLAFLKKLSSNPSFVGASHFDHLTMKLLVDLLSFCIIRQGWIRPLILRCWKFKVRDSSLIKLNEILEILSLCC